MLIFMKRADAIAVAGSRAAIMKALNISNQAIGQWGVFVPEASAFKLLCFYPSITHSLVNPQTQGTAKAQEKAPLTVSQ